MSLDQLPQFSDPVFQIMSDNTASLSYAQQRHGGGQLGEQPQASPDTMSSDSPGALHSMLGAMDKRVSEEVRRGGAVGGT